MSDLGGGSDVKSQERKKQKNQRKHPPLHETHCPLSLSIFLFLEREKKNLRERERETMPSRTEGDSAAFDGCSSESGRIC